MMNEYISLCLKLTKFSQKVLLIGPIVVVLVNLFMYKTCLCFYNSEVGYYNDALGFGINTYCYRALVLE